jgi:tRNA splicing ligase
MKIKLEKRKKLGVYGEKLKNKISAKNPDFICHARDCITDATRYLSQNFLDNST